MKVTATDRGESPLSATIDLEILVVGSHKKAPVFDEIILPHVDIKEDLKDFTSPIVTIRAS